MLQRTIISRTLRNFRKVDSRFPTCSGSKFKLRQRLSTMAPLTPELHPFTAKVVSAMRSFYPEELADRSWDNVGLLLENMKPEQEKKGLPTVLVTNDLTLEVAHEAVEKNATVIVSYHPFLFRPIKAVSLNDPHQRILLQLAQNNIAVYSPHTAVDAAPGGMNDWLADVLNGYISDRRLTAERSVVQPAPTSSFVNEGAGYGRLIRFSSPVNGLDIVSQYAEALGMRYVMVAGDIGKRYESVAVCPGSGYDVLKDSGADVIVTGEVTHHNALKAVMEGKLVVTVFHSNSERKYLRDRLRPWLEARLRTEVPAAEVLISEKDGDPFQVFDMAGMKKEGA